MIKIDTEKNMLAFDGTLDKLIIEMASIIYSILSGAVSHDDQKDLKRAMRIAYKAVEECINKEAGAVERHTAERPAAG